MPNTPLPAPGSAAVETLQCDAVAYRQRCCRKQGHAMCHRWYCAEQCDHYRCQTARSVAAASSTRGTPPDLTTILNDLITFLGNRENTRGQFPKNLSELVDDFREYATRSTVSNGGG